jgi:hypothetical protein
MFARNNLTPKSNYMKHSVSGAAICQKSWGSQFMTAEPGAPRAPARGRRPRGEWVREGAPKSPPAMGVRGYNPGKFF